jgi:hypothetical protein
MVTRQEVVAWQQLSPQAQTLSWDIPRMPSVGSLQVHEALEELPQLGGELRARMASALQAAIDHDAYFAFLEAPVPTFSLPLGGTL